MIPAKTLTAFTAALIAVGGCASPSGAGAAGTVAPVEQASPELPDPSLGIYAEAQAERGRASFRGVCAECHYSSEFRDQKFGFKWGRRTVGDLFRDIVRNMPEDDPGSLSDQEYVDLVAYILQLNGFLPGSVDLPADEEVLARYSMTPPPASAP